MQGIAFGRRTVDVFVPRTKDIQAEESYLIDLR